LTTIATTNAGLCPSPTRQRHRSKHHQNLRALHVPFNTLRRRTENYNWLRSHLYTRYLVRNSSPKIAHPRPRYFHGIDDCPGGVTENETKTVTRELTKRQGTGVLVPGCITY
jgi:hypothetical protein